MDCVFCKIASGEFGSCKVCEDEHALAFLDINPVCGYHTLVIPKKHRVNIFDIPADELAHVAAMVKRVTALYREKLGVENCQILHNAGAEAQQEVFHFHFHIIPRASGDGNNIGWKTHPELRAEFAAMAAKLFPPS